MKKSFRFITRTAVVALASCCLAESVSAQDPSATPSEMMTLQPAGQKPRKPRPDAAATPAPSASSAAATATLSSVDRDFAMNAAKGGAMEVQMGEMAQQKGQSAEVKKLAGVIVSDHTKANGELMSIAQAKGLKLDTRHKMDKLDSANFDQAWLAAMAQGHEKTIAAFQTESKSGQDPALKAFATKTLPTLKKHLNEVQNAQKKVGAAGTHKAG